MISKPFLRSSTQGSREKTTSKIAGVRRQMDGLEQSFSERLRSLSYVTKVTNHPSFHRTEKFPGMQQFQC